MKFITRQTDPWHTVCGEDGPIVTLTPRAHSLLTLLQWHSVRSHWPQDIPVAVALNNDTDVTDIVNDLPRLGMVSLHFPKWVDGRAYSQARLLRARHRYTGEIRAVGEVVVDMMPLLHRTGFDAVVLRSDQVQASAQRALDFFPAHYQGDAHDNHPRFARQGPATA
ncbi:MAG: DUF934 domain-containing protein [Pseudomonadota bacterium]